MEQLPLFDPNDNFTTVGSSLTVNASTVSSSTIIVGTNAAGSGYIGWPRMARPTPTMTPELTQKVLEEIAKTAAAGFDEASAALRELFLQIQEADRYIADQEKVIDNLEERLRQSDRHRAPQHPFPSYPPYIPSTTPGTVPGVFPGSSDPIAPPYNGDPSWTYTRTMTLDELIDEAKKHKP